MVLKLVDIKSPTLRQKAKLIPKLDKKVVQLIADMKETLVAQDDPEGIGLAAPQVGKSLQLFIVSFEGLQRVIINPKVLSVGKIKKTKSKKKDKTLEGCLSLPHYYGPIKRPDSITIKYMNELGQTKEEKFVGFPAHIIQHEIDHLKGKLFIDHILEQDAPLYKIHDEEWEEVELI